MKNFSLTRRLTFFWLLNLSFFCLSSLFQDSHQTEFGFLDFPKDQNIVCASGALKNKKENISENQTLALAFGASSNSFKLANNQCLIGFTPLTTKSSLFKISTLKSSFHINPELSRGPPLLFS